MTLQAAARKEVQDLAFGETGQHQAPLNRSNLAIAHSNFRLTELPAAQIPNVPVVIADHQQEPIELSREERVPSKKLELARRF